MKFLNIAIWVMLLCLGQVKAQNIAALAVSDIEIEHKDSAIRIDFTVAPRNLDVKSIGEITIIPEIISADSLHSVALEPVNVAGRNRWIIWQRGKEANHPENLLQAGKSAPLHYRSSVDYQDWMANSTVNFREIVTGCRSCPKINELIPVARLDLEPVKEYKPDYAAYYIHPKTEGTKVRNIEGQAYVDFPVNKTEIYPTYRNNKAELGKILASIDTVKNDPDCTVASVTLKGYASPEGSYASNTRLAQGRTATLRNYVMSFYDFKPNVIKTAFEPEDWEGLRKWVEASSIENKAGILEIINSDLAPDPKDQKIRTTYPVQYAYLLKEVYPGLRHSDYKIEYVVRSYTDPEEMKKLVKTAPQKLSLEEFFIAAGACEPGSEEYYNIFETAVKMYPTDEIANMNAANSAMARGEYEKAAKYLEKAGSSAHAQKLREILAKVLESKKQRKDHVDITFLTPSAAE